MGEKDIYSKLGVSSKKEVVHSAIKNIDKGLFPGAFCKIVQDVRGNNEYCSIFHSDGAGTKSSLAYMYYKETGDISVFRGIARDALVMNLDDVLCVGANGLFFISNNIGRNGKLISGEIVNAIISEYQLYIENLNELGLNIFMGGGETADVGDIVKTLIVDASIFTTMRKEDVIDAANIDAGDVIIGFESSGKSIYEREFNSGIGSNGLTLARHGVLSKKYLDKYPECFDDRINKNYIYFGKYSLEDQIEGLKLNIGKSLLSPTRTYAPVLLKILMKYQRKIHAIIHNTGGGQTKVMNFGRGIKYIKNNLFRIPKIFEIIQNSSETSWREMYQVFNMGHRLEIYCEESLAKKIISISKDFKIEAKVVGQCEKSASRNRNQLEIKSEFGSFKWGL